MFGECSCCMQAYFADLDLPIECRPLPQKSEDLARIISVIYRPRPLAATFLIIPSASQRPIRPALECQPPLLPPQETGRNAKLKVAS